MNNEKTNIMDLMKNEKVEWKTLDEIAEISVVIPNRKLKKNEYLKVGKYPIIDQGLDFIVGYTNDYSVLFEQANYIIFGDHTEAIKYVNFQFAQGADGIKVIKSDENYINLRYLFHVLLCFYRKTGKYTRHFSLLKKTKIPLPSIETQEKIVKILDKFTNYVTELQTELQKRTYQYEFYRDKLLNEKYLQELSKKIDKFESNRELRVTTLGEVVDVLSGGDVLKENFSEVKTVEFDIPIISNGIGEKAIYGYTNVAKIKDKAVTISARGTIGYAAYRDYPYYPIVRLISLIPKNKKELNAKYLYFLMQDRQYNLPETGIPQLTRSMFNTIKIILPSIEIQNIVVQILDKFQKLVMDTKGLLPKEIEERQKQYEYYREKLLIFDSECVRPTDRPTDFNS